MKSIDTNSSQLKDDFTKLQVEASFANIEAELPRNIESKPLDFENSESELTSIVKTRVEKDLSKAESSKHDPTANILERLEEPDCHTVMNLNAEDSIGLLDMSGISVKKRKYFNQTDEER